MAISNKSIRYYRQFYTLISIAVIIMMAVLSGSLLLGDSVRGTLVDRVQERLGNTETIIASGTGFLDESIMQKSLLCDATSYLLCEGFVSAGEKLIPVQVWGVDKDSVSEGNAFVNEPLKRQLTEEDFVLHLPSHSLVPSGSLFVTDSYSTQMRLHIQGVKTVEQGGNLLLRNEQALPLNVFVNRRELAEIMKLENKVNLIMSPSSISEEEFANVWTPQHSGISTKAKHSAWHPSPLRGSKEGANQITYDRIFIQASVVESLQPCRTCFAYLVNDIYNSNDSIPYSFVTAVDKYNGEALNGDEMVLSDYAANRLHASVGDTLMMDYFITKEMKSLTTRTHSFVVKSIVPLAELKSDSLLMTEYPGLSNVERCTDWDSDLPINMSHIEKEDENFWYAHRQTPKALVAYNAVKEDWSMAFGVATALEVGDAHKALSRLSSQQMGIVITHPRESALYAANNGTDFSALFLALGFFIILSGILLMQNPLVEMLTQRKDEITLYQTLGYSRQRIHAILLHEIGTVVLCASPIGIIAGVIYSGFTLFLLGNVWSGATHTEGFALHVNVLTLLAGWLSGLIICAVTAFITIRSFLKKNGKNKEQKKAKSCNSIFLCIAATTLILFIYNIISAHSIIIFVFCGLLWLITTGLFLSLYISKKASQNIAFCTDTMMWKTLASQRSQVLLAFWSLAVGVFTVFAVGLNRPDFSHSSEDAAMTGGFQLWCANRVPIEYDLNNPLVRKKLSIQDLPEDTHFMQILQYTQDEASCLNLNKVSTPTVLGVDLKELHDCFGIDTTLICTNENISHGSQHRAGEDQSPKMVLIDSESLTWSLMKAVGDTLQYTNGDGEPISLIIAGTYPTGIFHGNALMDKEVFRQLWKEETGSRLMLVNTDTSQIDNVKDLLEIALSEYGMQISTTTERIELFFTVTDTYLAIFLTLGGLGLILGVFCLIIVVRKNLTARQQEISTLQSLGFKLEDIKTQLQKENLVIPISAILSGSIGSIISISANASGAGIATILTAIIFLIILIALVIFGTKQIIKNYTKK
ncbi:MAG: ABC transporter permease [Prevotellaceae bacterium]|nr:ABC transporter permease [Candidatus Minthosoma caballi]